MDQHTGRKALITAKGKRTQADPTPQHTPHPHTHPHYPHPIPTTHPHYPPPTNMYAWAQFSKALFSYHR